jgi:hypothetical protein
MRHAAAAASALRCEAWCAARAGDAARAMEPGLGAGAGPGAGPGLRTAEWFGVEVELEDGEGAGRGVRGEDVKGERWTEGEVEVLFRKVPDEGTPGWEGELDEEGVRGTSAEDIEGVR